MTELFHLGRDLTDLARRGKLDPIVGREAELEQLLAILCRRTKSNPLLVGEPGVGKTALVDGLALKICSGEVPRHLAGRTVFELQLGALLAGTQFRGDLEQRVHRLLKDAQRGGIIVFIDEIHLLAQAGRGSGLDVGNLLKPALARGDFCCVGATTPSEAAHFFATDPAFERRFQTVSLDEPSLPALRAILTEAAVRLGAFHGLRIELDALEAVLTASMQPVPDEAVRRNPDRALDLLEDACAREHLRHSREVKAPATLPPDVVALRQELAVAVNDLNVFRHAQVRDAYEAALASWRQIRDAAATHAPTLGRTQIEETLAERRLRSLRPQPTP